MAQESDDIVSLPAPPPPNPAARRSAIDTAMRKFDGIEEPARPRARLGIFGWASTHRRATGGLVTAALIAVVGIPAIQVALRNQPAEVLSERAEPGLATADVQSVQDNAATVANEPPPATTAPVPMASSEPVAAPAEAPAPHKQESLGFTASEPEQKARAANAAPMLTAPPASPMASVAAAPPPPAPPPPPPPPPPAPMAEREAADAVAAESDSIVVTGSAVRRQNMKSAAPVTAVTAEEAEAAFGTKLRAAFASNNRKAILGLVGFPLRVDFGGGQVRTYRSRQDVERDYDRIFTPAVRQSLASRDSGSLTGNGRISFGCGSRRCPSADSIRIRGITP